MKLVNLIPLKEIDFKNQDQFDAYIKQHELRPSTKVTIAGKTTTAGQAAKDSKPVKGNSVFGKDKGGSVFGKTGGASSKSDKVNTNWMDNLDSIDVSDIKGKADPSADSWTHSDVFGATFKDPKTGKTTTVGDAYDREDDSPAYQKAFAYVSQFDPDGEAVMGTKAYDDLQKNAAPKADNIDALTSYKDFNKFFKANKDKLDTKYANYIEDEIGALKYLESDYKRGDADRDEVDTAYIDLQDLIKKALPKDTSKAAAPKAQLPKKASELDYTHAETLEKAVNAEAGLSGYVDTDENTDAIMYNASKGMSPTYTLYFGGNSDYNKPDEFRVSLLPTYGNDPSNIGNKVDKTFVTGDAAMKFMVDVAKKYKKELEMDDDKNESMKLSSILPKKYTK